MSFAMHPRISWATTALLGLGMTLSASADETVGTLSLDALSFISLGDEQILGIPPGSSIRFHFGTPGADGSIPFMIAPNDVAIEPIPVGPGQTLHYTLAEPASGWVTEAAGGRAIEFTASVVATTKSLEGGGEPLAYTMPFSTESVEATNLAHTRSVEITGMRLVENAWFVQLVGATTNGENAHPKPGRAVYTVLSGRFDRMP